MRRGLGWSFTVSERAKEKVKQAKSIWHGSVQFATDSSHLRMCLQQSTIMINQSTFERNWVEARTVVRSLSCLTICATHSSAASGPNPIIQYTLPCQPTTQRTNFPFPFDWPYNHTRGKNFSYIFVKLRLTRSEHEYSAIGEIKTKFSHVYFRFISTSTAPAHTAPLNCDVSRWTIEHKASRLNTEYTKWEERDSRPAARKKLWSERMRKNGIKKHINAMLSKSLCVGLLRHFDREWGGCDTSRMAVINQHHRLGQAVHRGATPLKWHCSSYIYWWPPLAQ